MPAFVRPAAMSSTPTTPARPSVESEVVRIRALLKERHIDVAVAAATGLAERVPENRDALYLLAIGERQQRRPAAALETLDRLAHHHPRFSRLYQERGHCYVALKDAPRAIEAYLAAVQINAALPATWSMLEGLYRLTGDAGNAALAAQQVAKLKQLPPAVVAATDLFSEGELAAAERGVRSFLLEHGDHVEAMRLLARIGAALQIYDDAEVLLAGVLERVPDYVAARHDYACVLLERHKYLAARAEAERLLAIEPHNPAYRSARGTALVGLGQHAAAAEEFLALGREAPSGSANAAEFYLSAAHALKTLGRQPEAIAAYREAARQRPNFGDAYWSLANLKTYRFTDEELVQIANAERATETALADRYHLSFALGKAYEDRADYAASWRHYEQGNRLKRTESRYRPEVIETNARNQIRHCTREFFEARRGFGLPTDEPVFIVGLPRSGSTLLEQILASHSQIEGTQELAEIPRYVLDMQDNDPDLDDPRYPRVLTELPQSDFARLAERYLDETRIYRTGKPRFIDKMPNNFRHIGLIHLMFPNATIIDARREPMACCFGNLKQLFARGQEFTYSIEDIARYYRSYLELMRHWDAALPGRVLRVHHEDVVDNLEANVRRLLDHCGLPFEPACLEFHRTERSVRTASSEQVRQPIYREGLEQWRHYEPWLEPLREALGDALVRYR
jgi:tetratricopeptide (TPR) repeat protein